MSAISAIERAIERVPRETDRRRAAFGFAAGVIATAASILLLAACGGGGDEANADAETSSAPSAQEAPLAKGGVVSALRTGAPVADCPQGGTTVEAGPDLNGNGLLDAGEVRTSQPVCRSSDDDDRERNRVTLVAVRAEPRGRHCAAGGWRIDVGADRNGNGRLDEREITSTACVCHGRDGEDGRDGRDGFMTLMTVADEPAGALCPAGGSRLLSGLDRNRNDQLDEAEVTSTSTLCHGRHGRDGASGPAGAPGINTLVAVVDEPAGAACPAGGTRLTSGLDSNRNQVLETFEVSTTTVVCHGRDGRDGRDGSPGADGLSSLMSITPEPAGANCTHGGSMIRSGLDSNRNRALDEREVTATGFVCNGAPAAAGAALTWRYVTTSTVQAEPNTGYLIDSPQQVTATLPLAPNVGDVVRVSGVGAGGWRLAQNAGQMVVTRNLPGAFGKEWTPLESSRTWSSIASSADGSRLAATTFGAQIHTSTDAGATWTARESDRPWRSIASSADGVRLVAVAPNSQIYTSADAGVSWTARESVRRWTAVASSADGSRLVAVVGTRFADEGEIYTSGDGGVTWVARGMRQPWTAVASSADGMRLAATANGQRIYISTDGGNTWVARADGRPWSAIASSADGQRLAAVERIGRVRVSNDAGQTWSAYELLGEGKAIAMSADGERMAATTSVGDVYVSTDGGATWVPRGGAERDWAAVAIAADGGRMVAAVELGQIYTSGTPSTTPGPAGSISGGAFDTIELQYIGNNRFVVLSHEGELNVL